MNPNHGRCSALPAFWLCASSWEDTKCEPQPAGVPALTGTEVHKRLALGVLGEPTDNPEPSDEVAELVATGMAAWETLEEHFPEPRVECLTSGDALPIGTVDVLSTAKGINILDWKSGWADVDYTPQLKGYAYCVWAEEGRPEAGATIYVVWLRRKAYDPLYLTGEELAAWEVEFQAKLALIGKEYNPSGDACRYCIRKPECVAHSYWLSESTGLIMAATRGELLRTDLADRYQRVLEIKKAIKVIETWMREDVEAHGPLPAGDGTEFRLVPQTRKSFDPIAAWPILEAHLSPESLSRCVKLVKSALKTEMGLGAKKGKKAAEWKALEAELDEAGAVLKKRQVTLRRVKIMEVLDGKV